MAKKPSKYRAKLYLAPPLRPPKKRMRQVPYVLGHSIANLFFYFVLVCLFRQNESNTKNYLQHIQKVN